MRCKGPQRGAELIRKWEQGRRAQGFSRQAVFVSERICAFPPLLQDQLQKAIAAQRRAEREEERLRGEAEALRKDVVEAELRAIEGRAEEAAEVEQQLRTRLRQETDALREAQLREAELVRELEEAREAVARLEEARAAGAAASAAGLKALEDANEAVERDAKSVRCFPTSLNFGLCFYPNELLSTLRWLVGHPEALAPPPDTNQLPPFFLSDPSYCLPERLLVASPAPGCCGSQGCPY